MSTLTETRRRFALVRTERGAADPMLVIGSIAVLLILLLAGAFGVIAWINSAHDSNAQTDLDKVAVAESTVFADTTKFQAYDSAAASGSAGRALEQAKIGFTPSAEGHLVVLVQKNGWVALSKSASQGGTVYLRTSESPAVVAFKAGGATGFDNGAGGTDKKQLAVTQVLADLQSANLGLTAAQVTNASLQTLFYSKV